MKPDEKKLDALVDLIRNSGGQSYWCKWCNRHIAPDPSADYLLFIHDDVYHPPDYVYDSCDEHRLQ